MKDKLLNKKSIAAIVTLLCTLVGALFGVDIDESVQQTIIEVGAGLIGGGVAGFAGAKKVIAKKVNENKLILEAGGKAVDGVLSEITAKAEAEFGKDVAAFVETSLAPAKNELKAITGIEWKF
mgnify:FL=1